MNKVWKDKHSKKRIYLISFLILLITGFYLVLQAYRDSKVNSKLINGLILVTISSFFLFNLVRTKLTYITNKGIKIGNAIDDEYIHLSLKNKSVYLEWSSISSLHISKREVKRPTFITLINYLEIKNVSGNIYTTFIADPKGFINTLKNLKKYNLVKQTTI